MANKNLFSSRRGSRQPVARHRNEAGGRAYKYESKHALAQLAATGCLSDIFYTDAKEQLKSILKLCRETEDEFVGKTAIFARQQGYMKDMPALLCAHLAATNITVLEKVFPRVITNGKMLRNFVQIVRSGVTGRKSLGSAPKRLVLNWLEKRTEEELFRDTVGKNPSIADIIKMVHPAPRTKKREALYGYILGKPYTKRYLPALVKQYERFKEGDEVEVPDVPFMMLTSWDLDTEIWKDIARNAPWRTTRMNLNTFARHGVFKDKKMVKLVAEKLRDPTLIRKARDFPYGLMMAYMAYGGESEIEEALQDAMEIATENVPKIDGRVAICVDVSYSMNEPITGRRRGATSEVRCVDVAALIGSVFLRQNPHSILIPFDNDAHANFKLNPRDSIMTNAHKIARLVGGGTSCSSALAAMNSMRKDADLVVYVSDNESWVDVDGSYSPWGYSRQDAQSTATMRQWSIFKRRNPNAKMVNINLQPYKTTQTKEHADIMNIGGFSDFVFTLMAEFYFNEMDAGHWVGRIEKIRLGKN
jgi:60 kDa SS-A/Ro ribonucleoprotein